MKLVRSLSARAAAMRATFAPMATRPRRARTTPGDTLFGAAAKKSRERGAPLADRMRPQTLADLVGQKHVLGPHSLLTQAIASDRVRSMILWGPPGQRQDDARARHRRRDEVALRAVQRGARERRRAARDRRRGARAAGLPRAAHDRLRRRDSPLQQGAARRVLAARRGRDDHRRRRDDREPDLRRERGAPLALQGVPPRAARSRTISSRSCERALATTSTASGPRRLVGGRRRASGHRGAARGDARRALSTLEIVADWRSDAAAARRHALSRSRPSRRPRATARSSTTRRARSTTTSSARSSNRCAAPIPTRRSTG